MIWETVRLAFRTIRRNILRSFLTVLGVVIGVAAVIAMVTVGQGSSAAVTANIEALGTNVLLIRPGRPSQGPGPRGDLVAFSLADAQALADLPIVQSVAPQVRSTQQVIYGNNNRSTSIVGSSADYLTFQSWKLASGRNFTPAEETGGANVCILGQTVRSGLFGTADPIGATIRVQSISCEVIGLLIPKGASNFGQDQDDTVIMPVRTVQRRLSGSKDVSNISVGLAKGISTEQGIAEITPLMRERRRIAFDQPDNFSVSDSREFATMLSGVNNVLTGLLSSVAAVSLLVGGIGIMNIMLVSVTERTREIGIRLAIGAEARQVLMQFLVEAVVLSLLGGALGIGAGLAIAAIASQIMEIPFVPSAAVVALAFGFSALVGVIFGYFPARRAARLDPIDALRHQ
ncbi:MAG: ABC transporter permease [Paracoccaceae bacterium]